MKRRIVGLAWAFALAGISVQSCANPASLGPGRAHDAGAAEATPSFTDPSDGGKEAEVEPLRACIGTECPSPFATCPAIDDSRPGSRYKCDIDLSSDNENCGECGHVCPIFDLLNLLSQCTNGKCIAACQSQDLKDCNDRIEDGCETDVTTDEANCGACGNVCPQGVACIAGACGCLNGKIQCNGRCVDPQGDDKNCGGCGNVCTPPDGKAPPAHTRFGCVGGTCGQPKCIDDGNEKWTDCNGTMFDGCEIDLLAPDPENCGQCGVACKADEQCRLFHGGYSCGCKSGLTECEHDTIHACVDLSTDLGHCGACNHDCPYVAMMQRPHQWPTCIDGVCGTACEPGWGDCNRTPADGCETNLLVSTGDCGACGHACDAAAGQPCINGVCLMVSCDAGETH